MPSLQDFERMQFSETSQNGASNGSATTRVTAVLRFSAALKDGHKLTRASLFRPRSLGSLYLFSGYAAPA